MPKSEKISLKAFWEAVEQKLAKYSTDELRAILRARRRQRRRPNGRRSSIN